jgi:hypothetical protein
LFRDCPTTECWHGAFINEFFYSQFINFEEKNYFWFLGRFPSISAKTNMVFVLGSLVFQFCLWEEKLRKRRPSYHTLKGTVQPELRWVKIGINRTAMKICVAGKCPLPCPKGHHHERSINILGGCSTF